MNADECNCKHIDYRGTCDNRNVFYSDSECLMLQDMPCRCYEEDITNQYNAVVAQNKSLQGELVLSKKIIKLMAGTIYDTHFMKSQVDVDIITELFKKEALQELEAEND